MNIEKKKLPNSEVELNVSVEWKDWSNFVDEAVKEISKEMKIQGFRPGKAPRNVIEQKIGVDAILSAAADKAIRKTYPEVLRKENVDAIGYPKVEILKLAEGNALEYKVVTGVMPEVTLKPWKDAIKKANKANKEADGEVKDEEVESELKKIAESRAKLITVERDAKNGDCVEIDFDVFQDNVIIEGGSSKKHNLVLGSNVFIPGFEEQLIGTKAGDEKEFEISFPEEYHAKHLAGKPALFKVKVNLVQEKEAPKVDDEFAKSLGKFESLDNLKENIKKGMAFEKEARNKEKLRSDIIEELVGLVEVEIPKILIDEELNKMFYEFDAQVQNIGMNAEQYLESIKKTKEDLEKDWKPQAEKRIKSALVIEKIAKEMELEIPTEEVEKEMNKTLQMYKNVKDAEKSIDMARLYNYTKGMLQNEKVFEALEKM